MVHTNLQLKGWFDIQIYMKYFYLTVIITNCLALLACSPANDTKINTGTHSVTKSVADQSDTKQNSVLHISDHAKAIKLATRQAVPDWITLEAIPDFPENKVDYVKNGIAYLIEQDEVRVTDDGAQYFSRLAYKVLDRKGLETAAQISQDFDPELGKLAYNFVKVTRGGKIIDRLPELDIQELRREDELSDGLVDGDITTLINLEDIQVGDTIDYAYYYEYKSPLWPGHFFSNESLNYGVPLAVKTYTVSVPEGIDIIFENINTKIRPQVNTVDGRKSYYFRLEDVETKKSFSNIPNGVLTEPYLLVSTMQNWSEVSQWGADVYDIDMSLPKDYLKQIKSLKRSYKIPEDRMVAALKKVQRDIRYLGIESGVNSHKPREPAVTLAKTYGDCKDKTVLLIAILRELGISAVPALVSTTSGDILPSLLPSINNFNHVIVMAKINDTPYWLDPTLSYQGGNVETLTVPDYHYALPFTPDQKELVEIIVPDIEQPTTQVTETYTLAEDKSMTLNVETYYRGAKADQMRRTLVKDGMEATSRSYLNYYAGFYPGLVLQEKMTTKDNDDTNTISVFESYKLSSEDYETNKIEDKLYVKAVTLEDQLPSSIEADREIKLGLNKGTLLHHRMIVHTPGRQFIAPEDTLKEIAGIAYEQSYESENETLTVDYRLRIDQPSVGLADAREVIELADYIAANIELHVYPKAARQKLSKLLDLDFNPSIAIETELREIAGLLSDKESVQALERLNDLESSYKKQDPLRGYIQVLRGAVLIDLKRPKEARLALDEGFSLYDHHTLGIYFNYASMLRSDDKTIKAADVLSRALDRFPEASKKLNYKWYWRMAGDLYLGEEMDSYERLTLALAKAQLNFVDDIAEDDRVLTGAIPILVRNGDIEEVNNYIKFLKSPAEVRDILIDKEMESIWPEVSKFAGDGLSTAMADYIQYTAKLAEAEGADYKAKTLYLSALQLSGKFDEALNFAEESLDNWSKIDAAGMDAYWFINSYAYLLSNMGKFDEANSVYEKLLDTRLENQPDLVSLAINHVSIIQMDGNHKKALAIIDKYETSDDLQASEYGWMFLHQAKACAMVGIGKKKEAFETYLENTKDITEENLRAHFLALVCLDQLDSAADVLKERLESEAQRPFALPIFSTMNPHKNPSAFEADLMAKVDQITRRPDVLEVFNKYGQSIHINGPAEYWDEY